MLLLLNNTSLADDCIFEIVARGPVDHLNIVRPFTGKNHPSSLQGFFHITSDPVTFEAQDETGNPILKVAGLLINFRIRSSPQGTLEEILTLEVREWLL